MNASQWNGLNVRFWDANTTPVYGTVVGNSTGHDQGTRLLVIQTQAGHCVSLPAAGVTVVPNGLANH